MNLQEVKAKCTGVSIATINLGNEYSLTAEVKWLIKQAEKAERLEEENQKLRRMIEEGFGFEDLYNPDDEIHPQSR